MQKNICVRVSSIFGSYQNLIFIIACKKKLANHEGTDLQAYHYVSPTTEGAFAVHCDPDGSKSLVLTYVLLGRVVHREIDFHSPV